MKNNDIIFLFIVLIFSLQLFIYSNLFWQIFHEQLFYEIIKIFFSEKIRVITHQKSDGLKIVWVVTVGLWCHRNIYHKKSCCYFKPVLTFFKDTKEIKKDFLIVKLGNKKSLHQVDMKTGITCWGLLVVFFDEIHKTYRVVSRWGLKCCCTSCIPI